MTSSSVFLPRTAALSMAITPLAASIATAQTPASAPPVSAIQGTLLGTPASGCLLQGKKVHALGLNLAPMRAATIRVLTAGSLTIGLAMPATAYSQQSPEAPPAPGIEASRLMGMPASLFSIPANDQTQPATSFAPSTGERPAPGAGPAAQATGAIQFGPTKTSRMIYFALQLTFYKHVMSVATQDFTRKELKGKFWREYVDSLHLPQRWGDKDGWEVNYIGHAISGGAFTRIWMEHREPKATTKSQYFKSLGRAMIFTAIFSTQYEMGPLSEASISNIGLNPNDLGWTDYVWTPIGAVLWTMAEDAIDKYVLTYIDKHVPFVLAKAAARMILNPSRLLANIGMNRSPWSRTARTMLGEPTGRK